MGRVIQFSAPALGGSLPPPETGKGWGGGEECGSQHPRPLPPHPCLPPRWGEGADAAVMHGEKRELNSPAPWALGLALASPAYNDTTRVAS